MDLCQDRNEWDALTLDALAVTCLWLLSVLTIWEPLRSHRVSSLGPGRPNHLHRAKGIRRRLYGCLMALYQTQTTPQPAYPGCRQTMTRPSIALPYHFSLPFPPLTTCVLRRRATTRAQACLFLLTHLRRRFLEILSTRRPPMWKVDISESLIAPCNYQAEELHLWPHGSMGLSISMNALVGAGMLRCLSRPCAPYSLSLI